jgi:DinB superfamily
MIENRSARSSMINIERIQKIENFGNAYYEITEALRAIPREAWQFRPAPNQWSIHDIIIHLADSEANAYVRFRKGIAEPGKPIMSYDQDRWADQLGYAGRNADEHLESFKWLRAATYTILRGLSESAWKNTVLHPEKGVISLESLLDTHTEHIQKHIAQIRRAFDQWRLQPHRQNI